MAFGERCEECRRTPVDYSAQATESVDSFDYCARCSKDLCPDCFTHPCFDALGLERLSDSHTPSEC